MKKLLVLTIFLVACGSVLDHSGQWGNTAFYRVEDGGASYFFEYPLSSAIGDGLVAFDGCDARFAKGVFELDREAEKVRALGDLQYSAWYRENVLEAYAVYNSLFDYHFVVQGVDVSGCVQFVDRLAESFGEKKHYSNERYGFNLELPDDFLLKYVDGGLVLYKDLTEPLEPKDNPADFPDGLRHFVVEMVVLPRDNVKHYQTLNDFIREEYPGYTVTFVDFPGSSGVYVDEGATIDSVKHYFTMKDGAGAIFEAYLKVPSLHYNEFVAGFEALVHSLKFD